MNYVEALRSAVNEFHSTRMFLNKDRLVNGLEFRQNGLDWILYVYVQLEESNEFMKDGTHDVLTIGERSGESAYILFQRKFSTISGVDKMIVWTDRKLKLLLKEAVRMERLGFGQYHHSGYVWMTDEFNIDVSRVRYFDSRIHILYNEQCYRMKERKSLVKGLRSFISEVIPMDEYVRLPKSLRDFGVA